MKSKLMVGIVLAILMSMLVLGQIFPMPISGRINAANADGQEIEITNLRTGITETTSTSGSGEFLYEWQNSNDNSGAITRYIKGDVFRVKIKSCGATECTKEKTYAGESELNFQFDLFITLPDTTPETQAPQCPVCNQPQDLGYTAIAIIAAIVAIMGGGIQIYKNRAGGVTMLHRHKGIIGYHDMNILHTNPLYKHARFKDNPKQFFKDVENIEKYGDVNYKE